MFSSSLVDYSRLQFAVTSMYHFLFVPLTLGLSFLLVIMESCFVVTGKEIYRDMTRFWGKLFGINFAMTVATGIAALFQFGTNWAYLSHYAGDIFGVPLVIEGLLAFFLEFTFVGLFFFAWNRVGKKHHLFITFLVAIGSNLSALWLLIVNAWMQFPTGSDFNFITMRMEITDFWAIVTSPWAQTKFMHTINASYMTGAIFVLAISSFYLIRSRDIAFAKRSIKLASVFGLIATVLTLHMGNESAYLVTKNQPTKIAAIEASWETQEAPASLSIVAGIDEAARKNNFEVSLPWFLGLMGTRSTSDEVLGINPLVEAAQEKIIEGAQAVELLSALRKSPADKDLQKRFNEVKASLGYGLLLEKYLNKNSDISQATPEQMRAAALSTIPRVTPMYWSFRIMVLCGLICLGIFIATTVCSIKGTLTKKRFLQKITLLSLPLPWLSSEFGWFVSEYGRQPWSIYEVLPVDLSTSTLSPAALFFSIGGFALLYLALLLADLWLMKRFIRLGPSSLGTGRYFFEKIA